MRPRQIDWLASQHPNGSSVLRGQCVVRQVLVKIERCHVRQPTLRIEIEGHTCSIGTAEYNLALGNRRATAVKDYLVSRGVTEDRLRTVSYGEERPKYDNAREETRRLNRRAALVVNLR